jgi:hypothetical protein
LQDALLHDFATIKSGFRFMVSPVLAHGGTFRDVERLEEDIAALYDVPLDQVTVEPPRDTRSHRRAVVTVRTGAQAHRHENRWDGRSTYDPTNGTIVLGQFADGAPSHWRLHKVRSGARGGLILGVPGSGKTSSLHVIAGEAGQAKLCVECGGARSCTTCRLRRICALFMGDPQMQPFGVWRGHADVFAWGPLATVRMISWLHAAMRVRAARRGEMEWTDHLGRRNTGKGWFDPTPSSPLLIGFVTEWPIIAKDPTLAGPALEMAEQIGDEGRKAGVALVFDGQGGDVDGALGDRGLRNALTAANALGHQSDHYAKRMLGLDGDPSNLPPDTPGNGYLRGFDRRSGMVQRTKTIPEYLAVGESGPDVREIAERIRQDPITFDQAVLDALLPLGFTGQGHILSDADAWDLSALRPDTPASAAAPTPLPATTQQPPRLPQSVVEAMRETLVRLGSGQLHDLMNATGMDGWDALHSADALVLDGVAVLDEDGTYRLANPSMETR